MTNNGDLQIGSQRPEFDIFAYNDFRAYLADYQKVWHDLDKRVNGAWLGEQLGLPRSRTYYSAVIKGKKVTRNFVDRFIELFAFNARQAKYFRTLVDYNQAEDPEKSQKLLTRLMRQTKAAGRILQEGSYDYYNHWRHAVVRAALDVYDFSGDDFAELARKIFPVVTPGEVRKSLELLEQLGLIARNQRGMYKPTGKSLTTGEFVRHALIKQYQQQVLDLAGRALLSESRLRKNNYTNCVSLSEEALSRIEEKIALFKEDIRGIVEKDPNPAKHVYHINLNLIPNSR